MTRREWLYIAGGVCLGAISDSKAHGGSAASELPATTANRTSLREAAAGRGLMFGAAVPWKQVSGDPPFGDLVAGQCGILTPELELKWEALRPTAHDFDFRTAEFLYQFAKSHQMLFRGHTLVWEAALPSWFAATVDMGNAKQVMLEHVSSVVSHFAGRMHSWDVVNEPFQLEDERPDGLKLTPWLRFVGPEYIELAFHAAHEADPRAMLVLNENWLEPENFATDQKRGAVLALLTRLVKNRVPIHGLGIQAHIFAGTNVTGPGFAKFLHAVEDLGLSIMMTELDVRDNSLPGDVATRDAQVAKQYYDFLSFMLQFKSVRTVLTWGLSDRFTWINRHNPRKDRLPVRPLLFDAELRPKPAFDAVWRAFEEAPKR